MNIYKISVTRADGEEAAPSDNPNEGPFLVAAYDAQMARMLVSLNSSLAALRRASGVLPALPEPQAAADCVQVPDAAEGDLKQRFAIAGWDISEHFIKQRALTFGQVEMARMVWWPCKPGDVCPA